MAAHAFLVSAQPASGAVLVRAPTAEVLRYSEGVDGRLSNFTVYDGTRDTVSGPAAVAGRSVVMPLSRLSPGTYTVSWSVVSADDGHHTDGSFVFTVWRGGPLPAGIGQGAVEGGVGIQGGWPGVAARALAYLGTFLLLGGAFAWVALGRAPGRGPVLACGAALLLALAAAFLAQGMAATGVGAERFLAGGYAAAALSAPFGRWILVEAAGGVGVAVGLALQGATGRALGLLGSAAVVTAFAMSGHPAASRPLLGAIADGLHLAAASAWVGGLGWLVIWGRRSVGLIPRFSPWAVGLVVVIVVTGVGNSLLTVHAWSALLHTLYGHVLDLKVALFLVMLGLAALSLAAVRLGAAAAARRRMTWEAVVAVAIVGAAAVLVAAPPATVTRAHSGYFQETRQAGSLSVRLTVAPATAGDNEIAVRVLGADGRPVSTATVRAQARSLDMAMQAVSLPLVPRGGGVYSVTTGALSMAGVWRVTLDAGAAAAAFDVTVDPPGGANACNYGFDAGLRAEVQGLRGMVTVIAPAPGSRGEVLVGTDHGAWLTKEGSWRMLQVGRGLDITGAAIGPDGQTWYLATASDLWVSVDGGGHWQLETVPPGQTIAALAASPWRSDAIWIGTPGGIWYSVDRGAQWERLTADPRTQAISRLVADPAVNGRLFAGSAEGILASQDGGRTWGLVAAGAKLAFGFAFVAEQPDTIWASAMDEGIWVSRDGGASWTESDSGVANPGGMGIAAIGGGGRLIAGTMGGGVAESQDYGATWKTVGCPASIVTDVAAQPDGSGVWVGEEDGIVRLRPGE